MNLKKKKMLAARTLGVGKERIHFVESRIDEIKEAITKQDIRDLLASGAIKLKDIRGRKSTKKGRSRSAGNVRKKINKRKENYVKLTRKLRRYVKELRAQGKMSREGFKEIRKKIKNKEFKSKANLKDYLGGILK